MTRLVVVGLLYLAVGWVWLGVGSVVVIELWRMGKVGSCNVFMFVRTDCHRV